MNSSTTTEGSTCLNFGFSGWGMRKKLIVMFAIIAAVPLIISTIISSLVSRQAIQTEVFQQNHAVATALARDMDQMIDARIHLLNLMAQNSDMRSMDASRQIVLLKQMATQYADMTSIIVSDAKGNQTVRTQGTLQKIDDRQYFKEVMNGSSFAISDVTVAKGTGKMSIILAVPIRSSAVGVDGVLVGVIDLQQLSNSISGARVGNSGYAFLVDSTGHVLAHPDTKLVEEMRDTSDLPPVKAALKAESGTAAYSFDGQERLAGYSFVPMSRWGVVVQQPMSEAMEPANRVIWSGVAVTIFAIVLALLFGIIISKVFTKPITMLTTAAGQLAEGDLTARVPVVSKDEFGQLGDAFNRMADNLKELIHKVINTAEQVAASAQELSATSNEAERAINQIAATVGEFAQGARVQTDEINQTVDAVDNLSKASQGVAGKAQTTAALATEMASAADEGGAAARNAVEKITEIKRVTAETAQAVQTLADKSSHIGQIVDAITNISGQTNLLALNAAIEAARAGTYGRGFAVVAEEVRKLAEQSQNAAQEIAGIVGEIQSQTGSALTAMQSGAAKVNEGVAVVSTAGQALQDIMGKIDESAKMIDEIAGAADEQVKGSKTAVSSIEQVAVIARQSSGSAEQIAAATEETTASMEEISGAAQALAESASQLQQMVARFTI